MELARSLVGVGANLAPVPGLNIAFEALNFIYESVKEASANREALINLVQSTAEILVAIDRVLSRSRAFDEHIQALLRSLTSVLEDFREFAEKHASKHLIQIMIMNVDVEGKIEQFQNRMQGMLMAFNIAALGSIDDKLTLNGHHATNTDMPPRRIKKVIDYEPDLVHASFTEPCTIKLQNSTPVLTCLYFPKVDLCDLWGLRKAGSTVLRKSDEVFSIRLLTRTWTWAFAWKEISVYMDDSSTSSAPNSITMVFPKKQRAGAWFSWLRTYAEFRDQAPPPSCDVLVRKKYECLMQKTPRRIERKPPRSNRWIPVLGGMLQSSSVYPTHFAYIQNGSLPFTRVYRSGDTLVIERFNREDEGEPVVARRYRFVSEKLAQGWYKAWEDCITSSSTDVDAPVKVEVSVRGFVTLQMRKGAPILDSALLPAENLKHWGIQKRNASITRTAASFEVSTLTTSWSWVLSGKKVTAQTTIASQPNSRDTLELVFRGPKSAGVWFTYLAGGAAGSFLEPRPEGVALTKKRGCWVQQGERSMDIRSAISDKWRPVFERYTRLEVYNTSIVAKTADGAHHDISLGGRVVSVERRRDAARKDSDNVSVMREEYAFRADSEARMWFDRWKVHLMRETKGMS